MLQFIYLVLVGFVNAVLDAWEGIDPRTDILTGIANRKHTLRKVKTAIKRALRRGQFLCIILIDLDGLKQRNDSKGHSKGDWFIKAVTRYINSNLQRFLNLPKKKVINFFGRIGGDELIIILPNTTMPQAQAFMASMERRAGERKMSWGISEQSPDGPQKSVEEMIDEADTEMYRHKQTKPRQRARAV